MARRLNTFVHVHVDGVSTAYGPGDDVPEAVAALITAPGVWEGEEDTEPVPAEPPVTPPTPADPDVPPASEIPVPRGNASTQEWRAYADAKGFETDEDITRTEIIGALDAAGIPTK